MKWYLIGETLSPLDHAPNTNEAAVVLLDSDELAHTSELPGLARVLHHTPLARDARVCKAEVRSDCLSGTLALPRSRKDGPFEAYCKGKTPDGEKRGPLSLRPL